MRAAIVIAAVVAATAASIPAASAATPQAKPCVRHDMPVPAGAKYASVADTDPTGRYQLGIWQNEADQYRALVWRNGKPVDLGQLPEANAASRISARGEIVGVDASGDQAYIWRLKKGVRTRLPVPAGAVDVVSRGINAKGEIAGFYSDGPFGKRHSLVWRPDNTYRQLPIPSGFDDAFAQAIDDNGAVLGIVGDGTRNRPIVWYRNGTWKLLPPEDPKVFEYVYDLRHGIVAGQVAGAPAIWNVAAGKVRTLPGEGALQHVNARRSAVGHIDDQNVLIKRSGVVRPIPVGTYTGLDVADLDDRDNVYGSDFATDTYAIRWSCR